MPDVPQFILDRLQAKSPIFTADEVIYWPTGLLEQLVAEAILQPAENARSVSCDTCGDDHVEKVIFIESPPGSEIRAYIGCPQEGRVRVPFARLRQWIINENKLMDLGLIARDLGAELPRTATAKPSGGTKRRGKTPPAKRSWTQAELNAAIQEYKAKRASTYHDLVDGVQRNQMGAKKAARRLFGRNTIAWALGVKSLAMVSRSTVWQEIANDLGLQGGAKKAKSAQGRQVGLELALEEQAKDIPVVDQIVRLETTRLVEAGMPRKEAEATLEKLHRGEITDDQAQELVEVYAEQKRDNHSRKPR